MPYVWRFLAQDVRLEVGSEWVQDGVRYAAAFVVLSMLYALLYGWLPDVRQKLRSIVPGALCGASLWIAAALISVTLRNAGKLVLIYGGFAGVVATLIFFYLSAATLILGAEINAVIRWREPGD
jgi:membrane protein